MTVDQMESLRTALSEFLGEFADCFGRCEPRLKLSKYVRGQLTGASALRLMNAFQHEWRRAVFPKAAKCQSKVVTREFD